LKKTEKGSSYQSFLTKKLNNGEFLVPSIVINNIEIFWFNKHFVTVKEFQDKTSLFLINLKTVDIKKH